MSTTTPESTPGASGAGVLNRIATGAKKPVAAPPKLPDGAVRRPMPPPTGFRGKTSGTPPSVSTITSTAVPVQSNGAKQPPPATPVKVTEEAVEPAFIMVISQKQAMALGDKAGQYQKWMDNLREQKKAPFEELFSTIADYRLQYFKELIAMHVANHAQAADLSFDTVFGAAKAKFVKSGMTFARNEFLHAWHIVARHLDQCDIPNKGGTGFGGQPPEDAMFSVSSVETTAVATVATDRYAPVTSA